MYSIALPLTVAYNQLLSVSHVPDKWKVVISTPVHKKAKSGSVFMLIVSVVHFLFCITY